MNKIKIKDIKKATEKLKTIKGEIKDNKIKIND